MTAWALLAEAVIQEKDAKPGFNGEASDYCIGWEMYSSQQPRCECTSDDMRLGWDDARTTRMNEWYNWAKADRRD